MVWVLTIKSIDRLIICESAKEAALTLIDFIYSNKEYSWREQDKMIKDVKDSYYRNNDDFGSEAGFAQSYYIKRNRDCLI